MPSDYLIRLDNLSTCNILEMESLVVQLNLSVENNETGKILLQDDLRGICKTQVQHLVFWIKAKNRESEFHVRRWLIKFRELTEIDFVEFLDDMRHKGEV